jgi:hypothetical protein
MAKYMIRTRDWKGSYDPFPKGWKIFCNEQDINTGQDSCATILFKGKPKHKKTPQEIYDTYEHLLCNYADTINGLTYEIETDNEIMTEK